MKYEILPGIGLGNFILNMNINQILTLLKRDGYSYKHCKIISGDTNTSPIYLNLPSEGITLRFNSHSQKLELIEKQFIFNKNQTSDNEYYFKDKIFYKATTKNILFEEVAKIFGTSKIPRNLPNSHMFLEYNGIGFMFISDSENDDISISDTSAIIPNSKLKKFYIYENDTLFNSLNNLDENKKLLDFNIFYDTNKPQSIFVQNENEKFEIKIGDHVEEVLEKLKNPNYIYNENKNIEENEKILYNQVENKIYYLNYFQYGLDIMIENNIVKKIIMHCNNIEDSKFGVYDRCNFEIKLRENFLKEYLDKKEKERKLSNESGKESNIKTQKIKIDEININEELNKENKKNEKIEKKNILK